MTVGLQLTVIRYPDRAVTRNDGVTDFGRKLSGDYIPNLGRSE
jgi:hypothetical protein